MDAQQTALFNAIMIAGTIIAVIIIYFIISIIGHQRRNQQLYKSKILAEVTTLEKERGRVAADLHDELGPLLASVKFKIGSLDIMPRDEGTINKVHDNLNELIIRIRGIANDLVPHTLLRKGLTVAIQEAVQDQLMLKVQFDHSDIPPLPQEKAVNLFRIFQEIMHNTLKHAEATELRIELKVSGGSLVMLTEDNGKGFDYVAQSNEPTGLGLRNLLSRTEILGGSMYIDSKTGKGTRYTFEIPL